MQKSTLSITFRSIWRGALCALPLAGLLLAGAVRVAPAAPTVLAAPQAPPEVPDLVQFQSGGHVLGFAPDSTVVSNGTYAFRVEYGGANPVVPRAAEGDAAQVTYPDLWPGISLAYDASGGIARSAYTVAPGAAPAAIRLRPNAPAAVQADGSLRIGYAAGEMRMSAPLAWQEIDGRRAPVDIAFQASESLEGAEVSFRLGRYDRRTLLTIQSTLTWNTFLGGSGVDYGRAIAVDGSGNVYVAGQSDATWGSPVRAYTSGTDAFAARLGSDGSLTWHTFLGGSGTDEGNAIAVDGSGNVYVAGSSTATWGSPVRAYTANSDAFAARLGSDGSLTWHTFLGESGGDNGWGIAVDGSGNVYVAGHSGATWGSPVRAHTGSSLDVFAARLGSDGSLTWHTFLGGSGSDFGYAIAVDGSGNVYVAGYSYATWGSPVRAYTSDTDAFAAKLGSNGSLTWNTFLGGSGSDFGYAIAVDGSGNVYVTGYSYATWGSPVRAYTSGWDVFAAKLGSDGSLTWNTFLGGSGISDIGHGIAVDGSGNVYVTGYSNATWGSPVRAYTSGLDVFAARLGSDGSLTWNTFLGGSGDDFGYAIAVYGSGNVYVAGRSGATWGSPVRAYTSGYDGFAARLGSDGTPTDLAIDKSVQIDYFTAVTYTVAAHNLGPSAADGAVVSDTLSNLTGAAWTCVAAGGAAPTTGSGTGDVQYTLTAFPVSGVVTCTVSGTLINWSHLKNTAEIVAPAGVTDSNMSNNSAAVERWQILVVGVYKNYMP